MDLATIIVGRKIPGEDECRVIYKIYSPGLVGGLSGFKEFMLYTLPRIQLQLALIYVTTQSFHLFFRRFGLPRILSEILTGLLLGRSGLGLLSRPLLRTLFPGNNIFLVILSKIGYIMYIFLIGVKMDPGMIRKSEKKGISIGVAASVSTFLIVLIINNNAWRYIDSNYLPAVTSLTQVHLGSPFPVIASVLMDLKIINTELGRLALASTLIINMMGTAALICINAYIILVRVGQTSAVVSFLQSVLIVVLALFGTKPLYRKMIQWTEEGKYVKGVYIAIICSMVFFAAIIADISGLPYHFVSFVVGLAVPVGPPLGSTLVEKLETFTSGLLAPLLITLSTMRAEIFTYYDLGFMNIVCLVVVMPMLLKFVLVFVPAILNRVPIKDAVVLGIILSSLGIVQGAYYDYFYKNETIDRQTFSLLTIWLAVLAAACNLAAKHLYNYSVTYSGYQKRNIVHTPYDSELRVLACAHRPDDALASIKLLKASSPCREAPIAAYALNLVELVGRATPLLINHKLGQKSSSGTSRSQQMVELFQNFERQYSGSVSVQVFTSMSLPKFVHHDICSLAFDKLASLIILPYHRKWNHMGKMVHDSSVQRSINREVLAMAPCSVGILVDRRKIRHENSEPSHCGYHVAVVFLGGQDDREALAYAKRMARSSVVHLTVLRIVEANESREHQWDNVLDIEILRDIKIMSSHQRRNIMYSEHEGVDGSETAVLVKSMVDAFDLIIVGRQHGENLTALSGLSMWSEVEELGSIGDILAAPEVNKPVSILVLQQQVMKC